jgi:fumarylpyruvate hydrolase
MGSDPTREPPFFFTKPSDAVVPVARTSGVGGAALLSLPFPSATAKLHYEVEQARACVRACVGAPLRCALTRTT